MTIVVHEPETTIVIEGHPLVVVAETPAPMLVVEELQPPVVLVEEPPAPVVLVAEMGPAGPQGVPGETVGAANEVTIEREAAATLSGHRLVVPTDDGRIEYADHANLDHVHRPVWLTKGATLVGGEAELLAFGEMTEPSWTWEPGEPIFLGSAGQLTQVPPTTGFLLQVAASYYPTRLFFDPKLPIVL